MSVFGMPRMGYEAGETRHLFGCDRVSLRAHEACLFRTLDSDHGKLGAWTLVW